MRSFFTQQKMEMLIRISRKTVTPMLIPIVLVNVYDCSLVSFTVDVDLEVSPSFLFVITEHTSPFSLASNPFSQTTHCYSSRQMSQFFEHRTHSWYSASKKVPEGHAHALWFLISKVFLHFRHFPVFKLHSRQYLGQALQLSPLKKLPGMTQDTHFVDPKMLPSVHSSQL